jgi:hypothetical protein
MLGAPSACQNSAEPHCEQNPRLVAGAIPAQRLLAFERHVLDADAGRRVIKPGLAAALRTMAGRDRPQRTHRLKPDRAAQATTTVLLLHAPSSTKRRPSVASAGREVKSIPLMMIINGSHIKMQKGRRHRRPSSIFSDDARRLSR